jgi:S1-C subfamily serine protease
MPFIGANVGGGIWKRFTMTLDYRKLAMMLTPTSSFGARDYWDRSGVFLINNGAITIADVRPGTPAAKAGLAKGDVITSVNGSSTLSLGDVRQIFLGPEGSVVHITIKKKDGTTRNVDLMLEDYV